MPFSSFAVQMLAKLLLIYQVCVTMGIVNTVSLPVSPVACYRKSSRHNHYPWSRSGTSSCLPTIRGSLLLRRTNSWREVGLLVHWRRQAVSSFAMNSGSMPGKFWKSWRGLCFPLLQLDQMLGKGWADLTRNCDWGDDYAPFICSATFQMA